MTSNSSVSPGGETNLKVTEDEDLYIKLIKNNILNIQSENPKSEIGVNLEVWAFWFTKQGHFRHIFFQEFKKYSFSVNKLLNIDFEIAVKYWVSNMAIDTSFHYIDQLCRYFLKFLKLSKGFTLSTDNLAEVFRGESERIQYDAALAASSFIEYFPEIDVQTKYRVFIKAVLKKFNSKYREDNQRDLPPTKEVYLFDWIVKDYFSDLSFSSDEFKIFFPIYLWWELSSIIPLRPVEFCGIEKNALITEGQQYILKLPREKNKKSTVQIIDALPIPDYLGIAIENYIIQTADPLIDTLLNPKVGYSKLNNSIKIYTNVRHSYLLANFYVEVVNEKYGYSVDFSKLALISQNTKLKSENISVFDISHPITTGDTRHFAMLNLMRQGYNPLEIARLAGHQHLSSQNGYYSHLKYWVDVEVLKLTEEITKKFNGDYSSYIHTNFKQKHVLLNGVNNEEYIQLDEGICLDLEQNCPVDNCVDCPFWRIDFETFKTDYNKINNLLNHKEGEIDQVLAILINLQKQFFEEKDEKDYEYARSLKEVSKNLDFLLRKYTTYKFNIDYARRG